MHLLVARQPDEFEPILQPWVNHTYDALVA